MLKLLREHEVGPQFRKAPGTAAIAVPFWGEGAIKTLGLASRSSARIICNLSSAACNPYVISDLSKLTGIKIRTNPRLHAKIYATNGLAIVGSSNASANGLTQFTEIKGSIEANVLSKDKGLVDAVLDLFEELWDSDQTEPVKGAALRAAQAAWDNRPKQHWTPTAHTLLAACRENPDLFNSVFVLPCIEPLGRNAELKMREVRKGATAPASGLAVHDFRRAEGYQFQEVAKPGSWLVGLDCGRPSKVMGYAQIPVPALRLKVKGEEDLNLAIPQPIRLGGRLWRLSSAEKKALEANAGSILDYRRDLVPLIKVIRIIDAAPRHSSP